MRALLALPLLLAGCGEAPADDPLAALEAELAADASDPAVAAALADPIMTDPALVSRADSNAVRPASAPYASPIPAPDVAARGSAADLIAREKLDPAPASSGDCAECATARAATTLAALATPFAGQCANQITYSHGWSTRLPDAVPLAPGARLVEAAGLSNPACDLRAIRYWSDLDPSRLIDLAFTRAKAGGYASERHADAIGERLSGRHPGGSQFALHVDPRDGGGSNVLLLVRGR